jgi:LmbE family N-acetylglucosaminyl deacetylase
MIPFVPSTAGKPLRVLCIGAHCDDIEIGCGGSLLHLQQQSSSLRIDWAIATGPAARHAEARRAMRLLVRPANRGTLVLGNFRDSCLPAEYAPLKDFFADLRRLPRPDVVFCHERDDRHQDHRIIQELTWGAFRDHVILEYEIPKWDGGLTTPNVYVPLTAVQARRKIAVLMKAYGTQRSRDWFRPEVFEALLRLRGMECRARSGYAEGFFGRKLVLSNA